MVLGAEEREPWGPNASFCPFRARGGRGTTSGRNGTPSTRESILTQRPPRTNFGFCASISKSVGKNAGCQLGASKTKRTRTRTHAALSAHGEFSPTQQHARSACHSHRAQPLQSVDRAHCSAARPKCAHAQVLVGNVDFFAPTNGYEAVLDREDVKQIINRRLNHPLYGGSVEEKRQVGLLSLSTHTSHPTTFRLPACTTLAPLCCPYPHRTTPLRDGRTQRCCSPFTTTGRNSSAMPRRSLRLGSRWIWRPL